MQVPYSWIKELAKFNMSPEQLAERLTIAGSETLVSFPFKGQWDKIVVGYVTELEKIPDSDHLTKAMVDCGEGVVQVVCGAPNVARGQKVVFAKVGAVLGENFVIKKARLRGVESSGMICSERELGLTDDHSGIMVLDEAAPVGRPILEYLEMDDAILNLDITPNRPDMLAVIGVARDVSCLNDTSYTRPEFELKESDEPAASYIKISIADPKACPRYAARIIKKVKIGPSPWWIRRKLILCGVRPINNVVDITNLVMLETGHPLHAFDYDKLDHKEIVVRRAADKERFRTLDSAEHELTPDVLLITDGEKGIAAAGIMGGMNTEVDDNTVNILLESAYFDPITTRRGRLKLGMITESSSRFEKGADPENAIFAINRAAALMALHADGEVLKGIVDCYPQEIRPVKLKLRVKRANAVLGTCLSEERITNILKGLDFEVIGEEVLEVTVPTFRPDITREIDLIEEIARIDGMDNIPTAERNNGPLFTKSPEENRFRELVRRIMTAQGYDEIYGVGLADPKFLPKLTGDSKKLKIINPNADDLSVLQDSVLYSLVRVVAHNIAHRNLSLRIFELGRAFFPNENGWEKMQLGLAVSGNAPDNWYEKGREYDFHDLKGALDALAESSNMSPLVFRPENFGPYAEGSSFRIMIGDRTVGEIGTLRPQIAREFDIKQPVLAAILDFDSLFKAQNPECRYTPLPRYPAALRDMALIVDDAVRVGDMMESINEVGGALLEEVRIFDLYSGKNIGAGKKSLAFSMVYRSEERSLESDEVADLHERIGERLTERFGAEIRKG